ncbi:MAG: DUF2868 domain-containing protein [Planctomycetota bacterium]
MKLADLVDLEWLIADSTRIPAEILLAARPAVMRAATAHGGELASMRARIDTDRRLREQLCLAVLEVARRRSEPLPGRRLASAVAFVGMLLLGAGLLAGVTTASAVLAYDGTTPVNVWHYALLFFGLQLVLLVLLLWFLLRSRRALPADGPPILHRLVIWLVDRFLGARGRELAELLRTLRTRHSLYGAVERWTLFALVQRFGVAFNLAALLTTLALVTGTDLTFSWSTTLGVRGSDMHRITTWLSAPWCFWPPGVPSLAAVEQSQWVRMPGVFVQGGSLAQNQGLSAEWWRFLTAGLVVYGLAPRLLALSLGLWLRRRALRAAGLDHAAFHALFERMVPSEIGWAGPDPNSVRGEPPRATGPSPASTHVPAQPGASAVVLCWGSAARTATAVSAAVAARFAVRVIATLSAGGTSLAGDAQALQALAARKPQRTLVVFAAGQQPTQDTLAFASSIRGALGVGRPIVVLLAQATADGAFTDAEPEEHAIWRRSLGTLGDPYLWLETLEGPR